ncbi:MAG: ATP-grasp domain-containing protein [Chitinophagaceae bacterium]|nr:ATP-grasp domain-containing protein [Chitinophagaceae bacterium]MCA6495645.1 ATP-grasp domain-containing protein [Chitinophagaceae bacterium]MCA6500935.1 ATP-grasp domain-containing protein [Chitinophagaceae bacterium]
MSSLANLLPSAPALLQWKIWVLAPSLESNDQNIDYYYDFSQSIAEYTRVFQELQLNWQWQPITLDNYTAILSNILQQATTAGEFPLFLNLCDGDEINGTPGISILKWLHNNKCIYTGADEYFYQVTTSKIPMKEAFEKAGVPTPPWKIIRSADANTEELFAQLGSPLILKPAISGGSMGVGVKNVVNTPEEAKEQIRRMFEGYRGWNLAADGIIAEQFIAGEEYTTLIAGSALPDSFCKVYDPVERIFHSSLREQEKFLSFDRLWEIYEEETPMPEQEDFYRYALPAADLLPAIRDVSLQAYQAVQGKGYTRADIRRDKATGQLYVLEVNAQCGLSEDENYTSIGAILRVNQTPFAQLIAEIILDALQRAGYSAKENSTQLTATE